MWTFSFDRRAQVTPELFENPNPHPHPLTLTLTLTRPLPLTLTLTLTLTLITTGAHPGRRGVTARRYTGATPGCQP